MPSSSENGKVWIGERLKHISKRWPISKILDLGAGCGTYWEKYHNIIPGLWIGIEVWKNYITQYDLRSKYDNIIDSDARTIDYAALGSHDIVFAGDILEHMTKSEAKSLADNILKNNICLIISIPITYSPQGEWGGNPYEVHIKDDWSDQEFKETFDKDIISSKVDNEIGVYILSRNQKFINAFKKIKIAIYTICKNEERFIQRWANSNSDADYRLVCDTGSTDNTVATLQSHNINVIPISVMPWRFDTARNTVLNLLPSDIDICVSQDLDEELLPGWRTELEHKWHQNATIAYHRYRHNNNHWQWHSKIHARHGCWWTGIVHETLSWNRPDDIVWIENLFLDEHQDTTKSRSNYLQLILQKIQEGDKHWRTYYFLANEYENIGDIQRSIDSRKISYDRCDDGNTVLSYIAKNLARQYSSLNDQLSAEKWFRISTNDSDEKESWFAYCQYLYNKKDWEGCYIAAKKCISISEKRTGFTYDVAAWDWHVYDYAALSAYNIGLLNQAAAYGKLAVEENPGDERLRTNLKFYEQS